MFSLIFLFLTLAGVVPSAQALQQEKQPVLCKLVSSVTGTGAQDSVLVGAKIEIEPGWKIYAPDPNASANPDEFARHPVFEWRKLENIKEIHFHWPGGELISDDADLELVKGYTKSFVLPLTLDLRHPHKGVSLHGTVSMIACSTQCIPVSIDLSLSIPEGIASKTIDADDIVAARVGQNSPETEQKVSIFSLLWMMLVAFIGGALLNFMPCVLPVLSLKLRSFLSTNNTSQKTASLQEKAGASLLGIMTSFWGLALAAILIERSGDLFGWGLHFQSPAFLGFMAILLFFFGKSLWKGGSFDLPNSFKQRLQTLLGNKTQQKQEWAENFLTGMFATLLATPCTAPFLGTALAYALSQGPYEIGLLFTLMGLGFAFPYLIFLFVPASKLWLPKPGPWMETLSKGFALLLFGTLLWVGWLLTKLLDWGQLLQFLILLVLTGVFTILGQNKKFFRRAGFALLGVLAVTTAKLSPSKTVAKLELSQGWDFFEEDKIAEYVAQGKTVFVDVTASWCLTCQANKKLVLDVNPVKKALSCPNVIKMRADWTQPNPKITAYLKSFHRHGIPFNIIYTPKHPKGYVLPELLSSEEILKVIEKCPTP